MDDYSKTRSEDGNLRNVKHGNKKSKNLSQHISEHRLSPVGILSISAQMIRGYPHLSLGKAFLWDKLAFFFF